jgi:hypothetical protein
MDDDGGMDDPATLINAFEVPATEAEESKGKLKQAGEKVKDAFRK